MGEYVFSNPDGNPLEINTMYRRLEFFCKKAGLRKISFHTLRHTFASHFIMKGGSLKSLQEILGHSKIEMTMKYAHLSQEYKRKEVNLLNSLTGKPRKKKLKRAVHENK